MWCNLVPQKYSETSKWPTASIFIVEQSNLKRKQYFRLKSPWFLPGYSYHAENLDSFHTSFAFCPPFINFHFTSFLFFRRTSLSCEKRLLFFCVCPSVHPSVFISHCSNWSNFPKIFYRGLLRRKFIFLNRGKKSGTLHKELSTFILLTAVRNTL